MATKKAAAKRSAAKDAAVKTSAKKTTEKSAAKKVPAKKVPAVKTSAKKTAGAKSAGNNYTKPELRDKIKNDVMAGDKGGRAGQWSARKAQLVAHEYEAEGGGYKGARNEKQQHLKQWGDEKWHTADGKQAIQGETTHRYLPDKAWEELSPEEKKQTDAKKVRGSREGKQFVPNSSKAKVARKHATKG